jgi:cytochrome c-type biogenesis protein CcmH
MRRQPCHVIRLVCTLLLFAITLTVSSAIAQIKSASQKTIDTEVMEIANELMCPVCQGQSVAESNSELARDMRGIIRQKLEEGQTREEIIGYFVERYGESILGAPPMRGFNIFLWALPALAFIVGGLIIARLLHSQRNESSLQSQGVQSAKPITESEYEERLRRELERFET